MNLQPISAVNGEAHLELLRSQIAQANNFELYREYSENQAAHLMGFKPATLKRRRMAGLVAYVRKGSRKVTYFGFQIADYLISSIKPYQNSQIEISKSQSTGSPKTLEAPRGAVLGTTPLPSKQSALASAQRILSKPNNNSRIGL